MKYYFIVAIHVCAIIFSKKWVTSTKTNGIQKCLGPSTNTVLLSV